MAILVKKRDDLLNFKGNNEKIPVFELVFFKKLNLLNLTFFDLH